MVGNTVIKLTVKTLRERLVHAIDHDLRSDNWGTLTSAQKSLLEVIQEGDVAPELDKIVQWLVAANVTEDWEFHVVYTQAETKPRVGIILSEVREMTHVHDVYGWQFMFDQFVKKVQFHRVDKNPTTSRIKWKIAMTTTASSTNFQSNVVELGLEMITALTGYLPDAANPGPGQLLIDSIYDDLESTLGRLRFLPDALEKECPGYSLHIYINPTWGDYLLLAIVHNETIVGGVKVFAEPNGTLNWGTAILSDNWGETHTRMMVNEEHLMNTREQYKRRRARQPQQGHQTNPWTGQREQSQQSTWGSFGQPQMEQGRGQWQGYQTASQTTLVPEIKAFRPSSFPRLIETLGQHLHQRPAPQRPTGSWGSTLGYQQMPQEDKDIAVVYMGVKDNDDCYRDILSRLYQSDYKVYLIQGHEADEYWESLGQATLSIAVVPMANLAELESHGNLVKDRVHKGLHLILTHGLQDIPTYLV